MLKKLLGVLVLVTLAAAAATVSAETIAEWDFGKEVLRLQGETDFVCEYPDFADKIATGSAWDAGALLKVTDAYDSLPAQDEDGMLSYTYTADIPYDGVYKILIQANALDSDYYSKWKLEIDGNPAAISPSANRKVDITTANSVQTALTAGEHTLTFYVPKAAKGGEGAGRFYFYLDYIDFHYCYDIDHSFSKFTLRDPSASNSAYPAGYEFAKLEGDKTQDCYAEFIVNAPADGLYIWDFEAQLETHGSISAFEAYVNGEKVYNKEELARLEYGSGTTASVPGDREFLRNYQFAVELKAGENALRLVSLNDGKANQWLLLDTMKVSSMENSESEKIRIEGESAVLLNGLFTQLPHASTRLIGYNEFGNGIALQTYGTRQDGTQEPLELHYTVNAAVGGKYSMGFLSGLLYSTQTSSGCDFDVSINGVRYAVVDNAARTENYIPASASKAVYDMYIYSYNHPVYLNTGENQVIVHVKPRPQDGQFIFDLDYIDFTLKEAGAKPQVSLSMTGVKYNGAGTAPAAGTNLMEFEVSNNSAAPAEKVWVVAAVYGNGQLKNAYSQTTEIRPGKTAYLTVEQLAYSQGETVKVFLWNGENLQPLSDGVYTYPAE